MKVKVDHSKLRAKPEDENFTGKYTEGGLIAKKLVDNYFTSVSKLLSKCMAIEKAHEIGVGEGLSTKRLKSMVPFITASEFVEDLVKKAQINNPNINVFQESVYDLKYENDAVDLVFLLEVLEHLDFPAEALHQIKRVSSKYLILGVPREPLWRFLNMCRFKYLKDFGNTPGHLNHWSTRSIIRLVEQEFGPVIAVESPIPWTIILAEKKQE